ncbi:ABC transporter permease [Aliikangiella sp. IMCC44653]
MLIPVGIVLVIMLQWSVNVANAGYAIARMLLQLLSVGYFLTFLFSQNSSFITTLLLGFMLLLSCWIGLRTSPKHRMSLLIPALVASLIGGGFSLVFVVSGVLQIDSWGNARYIIPLGSMIFASTMNSISLASERYFAEVERGTMPLEARNIAFNACMIPVINSLFAVGLVSLPGMMTGQILSGVSPFVASQYQILVMCMIFSSTGITAAYFLRYLSRS